MPSYRTLKTEECQQVLGPNLEALIVDGVLMGVIAGPIRIYADKGSLKISVEEPTDVK